MALCNDCGDAARTSLANEIRGVLKSRGLWAPGVESDLITAIAVAIDAAVAAERVACLDVFHATATLTISADRYRDAVIDAIRKRGG